MSNLLRKRADLFGKYISAEVKGAIVTRGYTQTDVAKAIDRQGANLSRWLNGKPTIPIEVAMEVCNYIGIDIRKVVDAAEQRVIDELGPWPPIEVNQSALSDEEMQRRVNARIDACGFGLAADHDPDKEASKGVESEFA